MRAKLHENNENWAKTGRVCIHLKFTSDCRQRKKVNYFKRMIE